jgi:hypothetical protein
MVPQGSSSTSEDNNDSPEDTLWRSAAVGAVAAHTMVSQESPCLEILNSSQTRSQKLGPESFVTRRITMKVHGWFNVDTC